MQRKGGLPTENSAKAKRMQPGSDFNLRLLLRNKIHLEARKTEESKAPKKKYTKTKHTMGHHSF